jgi:hypothetical protein
MLRALVVATMVMAAQSAAPGQTLSVLHIKVTLIDAERKAAPVPRHALLISDNPASAPPRRVVTTADGTADVRLRPGNYTVESDQPVAFLGKAYQGTRTLDIATGRDTTLELTAANAEIVPLGAAMPAADAPVQADPSGLLMQWQDSVVGVWTRSRMRPAS